MMYITPLMPIYIMHPDNPTSMRSHARFQFDHHLPCQVTLMIRIHDNYFESIDWVFSRDLLIDGMEQLSGMADVQVWTRNSVAGATEDTDDDARWRTPDRVFIRLRNSNSMCIIVLDESLVRQFINHTLTIAPREDEDLTHHVDEFLVNVFA